MPHPAVFVHGHASRVYESAAERLADYPLWLAPLPWAEELPAWVGGLHEGSAVLGLAVAGVTVFFVLLVLAMVACNGKAEGSDRSVVRAFGVLAGVGLACGLFGLWVAWAAALLYVGGAGVLVCRGAWILWKGE